MTRSLDVRLHDTHIGIWQDDPNDPTFKTEIFAGIRGLLWRRGWTVGEDPACHYRSLRPSRRLARKGNLIASLSVSGRHIEFECWAETWQKVNPNGHRYDFSKRPRLHYIDRLRLVVEERAIIRWLEARADVSVSRSRPMPSTGQITAIDYIEQGYAESWHSDKKLGRPVPTADDNRKSADGFMIEHGATVWTTDSKGRLIRGTAFYHINNMWWVVTGPHALHNKGSSEIYAECPEDVRRKRNGRARRERLEAALAGAIRRDDFQRAALLRKILFGDAPTYRIWNREHSAYYRSNCCGYTTDAVSAGRYTRAEAEREVRRVPHLLHAIRPDGRREDFASAEDAA